MFTFNNKANGTSHISLNIDSYMAKFISNLFALNGFAERAVIEHHSCFCVIALANGTKLLHDWPPL